jgi:hypothetical protein
MNYIRLIIGEVRDDIKNIRNNKPLDIEPINDKLKLMINIIYDNNFECTRSNKANYNYI